MERWSSPFTVGDYVTGKVGMGRKGLNQFLLSIVMCTCLVPICEPNEKNEKIMNYTVVRLGPDAKDHPLPRREPFRP